ncbi:MAG: DUF1592 domain-containing protein [Acidobacteria bacterium]|nr:DUF1592 domain-containing protein [Acidobacteriota bacterium]
MADGKTRERTRRAIAVLAVVVATVTLARAFTAVPTPLPDTVSRAASVPAVAPEPAAALVAPAVSYQDSVPLSQFLDQHCAACHNDRARAGGMSLAGVSVTDIASRRELWESVRHKLVTGQMPPAGRPVPERATLAAVTASLTTALDAAAIADPDPGRVGLHRLNRAEYANAIRDLFGLTVDAKALLLPDEADEGFDNVAVSLALSPSHLERYLSAAREISRLAVGDPTLGEAPATHTYRVPKLLEQDVRLGDDMPFGSRGGVVARHTFPLDGEYRFRIRLRRQVYDYIVGMGHAQQIDVRVDGVRVARFTVGGDAPGTPGPLTWNGEIVGDTEWELYMHAADAALEARTTVTAGPHVVTAAFVDSPWEREGVTQPLPVDFTRGSDEHYDGHAAVDALTILGPYAATGSGDTPSRRAVFTCTPATGATGATDGTDGTDGTDSTDDTADTDRARNARGCASTILTSLARRAYRRPPTQAEVQTLLQFYDTGSRAGGFEAGIQAAIERMLVSFNFLFRIESDPQNVSPGATYRLTDSDLASRLSFSLWSSIPDDELLAQAAAGRLRQPAVIEQQVRRMLADPRSRALVQNFGSQWLGVRKAESWQPDPDRFPEFDENLRRAFLEETSLFLDSQFRDDRSIVDLLSADYTFMNARLAEHYGVAGVDGERFRRVTWNAPERHGLLGHGSVLMVTSYPDRTTPVVRGFWVLENLLGMPPPPPPPNVPDLETTDGTGRVLSMREQMEMHRRNPACAACHVRMDPIGFSLENFDAIGRWRHSQAGRPVDASATFTDGTALDGVNGLRAFLLARRAQYVETFASRLMTYALGRHITYRDQPALRAIVTQASRRDYRWSAIILGIVNSPAFQMRKAAS